MHKVKNFIKALALYNHVHGRGSTPYDFEKVNEYIDFLASDKKGEVYFYKWINLEPSTYGIYKLVCDDIDAKFIKFGECIVNKGELMESKMEQFFKAKGFEKGSYNIIKIY